jgi:hypothetical protein
MQVYHVEPRGNRYMVVDYDGHTMAQSFVVREYADLYAKSLNAAHQRHRVLPPITPHSTDVATLAARHELRPPVPSRRTIRQQLRALVIRFNRYRQVRIGL